MKKKRKKRIVAKLMALSLMFSGFSVTSVYGAEILEPAEAVEQEMEGEGNPTEDSAGDSGVEKIDAAESAASDEQDVTNEMEDGEQENSVEEEASSGTEQTDLNREKTEIKNRKVSENTKMAGSNGILYDDVTYLSARNVLAMDEEMQEVYRMLCDGIAASKEGGLEIEDVVLAVNEKGDLYCSYYVPMLVLEEMTADMMADVNESLAVAEEMKTEDIVEEEKEDEKISNEGDPSDDSQETAEEEKKDGGTSGEGQDAAEEEKKDGDPSGDGQDTTEEEKKDGGTSGDGQDTAEEEKKDSDSSGDGQDTAEEEKKDGETSSEGQDEGEEKKDSEIPDEGQNDVEREEEPGADIDDNQDAWEEDYVLSEENLDKISDAEEETFEVAEPVRIENTIDLGYGSGGDYGFGRSGMQFYSVLPTEDYFEEQLTSTQKEYYQLAKEKLAKGSNQISIRGPVSLKDDKYGMENMVEDVARAASALILTYPEKTDWMAKPGGFNVSLYYKEGAKEGDYKFTFEKSRFYSGSLDSKANAQAQTVGSLAMQYAAEEYPDEPVYGIIKYFDNWVCENGYYEWGGTTQLDETTPLPVYEEGVKVLQAAGWSIQRINALYQIYYNCHSVYGILLEGYGVCESYAKAMSRLLDVVGIPNIYVVGMTKQGGHAWNYVQMPDGKWYLLDSTWNDSDEPGHTQSEGRYLLVKEDGEHIESGCSYNEKTKFTFPGRNGSNYIPDSATESVSLNKKECNLAPKEKETLTYQINGADSYGKITGVWSSSNDKVAKVDQNGVVTAVAAGEAVVTFSAAGMSAECIVSVDQIKAVKVAATKKTSESVSLGIDGARKGSCEVILDVDMGNSPHTAQWMIEHGKTDVPTVVTSKLNGVAEVTAERSDVTGNQITVHVQAQKEGSGSATVKFAAKSVTIKVSAGKIITKDMFEVTWPDAVTGGEENKTTPYTGKAVKPVIKKKSDADYKPVTFKTTYINNKDAGAAKVVVTGTGKYGGVIEYPFTITPLDITGADFSKALKSKAYNGGANPPAATVKFNGKTLKADKDYEILFTGGGIGEKPDVVPAGTYTIQIRGIGNYTGTVKQTQSYQVTKNTIDKIAVTGAGNAKYTGVRVNPYTVKMGKNILPDTDYEITWYQGQGNTQSAKAMKSAPVSKGKYTAVITVRGGNLTTTARKTEIKKNFTIK